MSDPRRPWTLSAVVLTLAAAAFGCRAVGTTQGLTPPVVPPGVSMVFGVITDETGAILPGVTVTAVSMNTKEMSHAVTDAAGRYQMRVAAGPLQLSAELTGFKKFEMRASAVFGRVLEWSPPLGIGAQTETIMVTGGSYKHDTSRGRTARAAPPAPVSAPPPPSFNTESYTYRKDSDFRDVAAAPMSTFSIDVDSASYANVRRFLNGGQRPPVDAVRIEEMLNYFPYEYAPPSDGRPFAAHVEIAPAPWAAEHRLVRIGLKAREVSRIQRPASNLVFLVDVSGSMTPENKLPLVRRTLKLLVEQLDERDRVAMVVYAGAAGLVLPPTPGDRKEEILAAVDRLSAGGSTNGGAGIRLAYDLAVQQRIEGGVNRVILATDGDFNVGVTDQGGLVRLVQEKAKAGVFLSAFGFGMGNYKDSMLERLADEGDGHYGYIDTFLEARKAFVEELTSTLVTVAKDVKIQVEWNPVHVRAYRLIGYENRLLNDEDFNDDTKDAGEVGAGHQVTALYEIVPPAVASPASGVDPLVFSKPREASAAARTDEILRLKLRYKAPDGGRSEKMEWAIRDARGAEDETSTDFRFASAVAAFGMWLRQSPHAGTATPAMVKRLAEGSLGLDRSGYRAEFLSLLAKAERSRQ